jgi:hypothetical protein
MPGLTLATAEDVTKTVTQDAAFASPAFWVSLHSANPGTSGANEITSGTGPGGRQPGVFSGTHGLDDLVTDLFIEVAATNTATWMGWWTARTGGTFVGGWPLVTEQKIATAVSGTPHIVVPAHGLGIGDKVKLYAIGGTTSAIPGGLSADTRYYVVGTTSQTIEVSATTGGSAITPSGSGGFAVCRTLAATFSTTGILKFPASTGLSYETTS